ATSSSSPKASFRFAALIRWFPSSLGDSDPKNHEVCAKELSDSVERIYSLETFLTFVGFKQRRKNLDRIKVGDQRNEKRKRDGHDKRRVVESEDGRCRRIVRFWLI